MQEYRSLQHMQVEPGGDTLPKPHHIAPSPTTSRSALDCIQAAQETL